MPRLVTRDEYQAAIAACCAYQTVEEHAGALGLCWGLCAAVRDGKAMDCTGCELATRSVFRRAVPQSEGRSDV